MEWTELVKVVDALPRFFANSDRVWLLSPSMPLDIISKDNLFDLEGKLRVLESEPEGAEATIRLARQTSGDFFCESSCQGSSASRGSTEAHGELRRVFGAS